jgi:hypothetical protein
MPTSNKNDAPSISKLALLASAAATAAFVVSQSRLMQKLTEPLQTPPAPPREPPRPVEEIVLEAPLAELPSDTPPAGEAAVTEFSGNGHNGHIESSPLVSSSGSRIRVRTTLPARERLHYGLPVRSHSQRAKSSRAAGRRSAEAASVAIVEPPLPATVTPEFDNEEWDAEYVAICEAIAHDGRLDEPELDPEPEPAIAVADTSAATATRDAIEDMWWLPAPRLRYILAALAYVAASAIVGSDPITLAADGFGALATVNSATDFVLLGWIFCGLVFFLPFEAIAGRALSFVTRGEVQETGRVLRSTGWTIRLLATSAFIAGAVLYSPHALRWALDTDYPVAAVSTSSMAPSLHEGELVLIDGVDKISDIQIDDIIAFQHGEGIAVLRVTGFENDAILAQADAGTGESFSVPFKAVTGRVLTLAGAQVKLPLLGNISLLGKRTVEPTASVIGPR